MDGASNTTDAGSAVIDLQGVWKIFGARQDEAMAAIRARGLTKPQVLEAFNCVVGVADASFQVRRGEIFCIMGLSGSGKSTLVRHVNRLLTPTAGSVVVSGTDMMALSDADLLTVRNEHIAMVFQNFGLMPHRSVRDNVAMPLEIRGWSQYARWRAAEEALALVDLSEWTDKFAHELSGGMQQRVGLARAIAADAEVLLMDEPFSALDPLIRRQLQEEFMRLASQMNKTTLFITHDLEEAVRIGDRIAIMKDGVIVQTGTPEQIIMNPADAYVMDFVSGISRINLIRAHSLARPKAEFERAHGALSGTEAIVSGNDTLRQVIVKAADSTGPILVRDEDLGTEGVITKNDILNGVILGTEEP
ncbi:glycine/betaine ABC transporter [Jannaschia pagri]|uniref:Quaternary amine transport ATP-binding protein n=1 Tax=Jannaschia pagri TaxID=2829797 RepID=A0ABQ4NQ37_9RHOB|nr:MULTISPECIES: betaine/proline/choline family ABC transporter ATP-binding protein [unclassified Jannaschia]GIT92610.1 glycine/betaine ABC transporter [Jannaschia sp. AI_61]GIT96530.1 glycine/betaine ABC transporter [Jannaschia sp. AI_62]